MLILIDNLQNSVEENVRDFNRLKSFNTAKADRTKFSVRGSTRIEAAEKFLTPNFLIKL